MLAELLGRHRAARAQQVEVLRHEVGARLLVARVHRQREQLAVRVRVHVAGRADEVRDVRPPRAVALGDLDRVAEHVGLRSAPRARRSARSTARPRRAAPLWIASSKRFIAVWRNTVAIWSSRFDASSARRSCGSSISVEQTAERDGLAEHRRGLRERERRRLVEHALRHARGTRARRGRARARASSTSRRRDGPVEQHVRVVRRHRVRAERARSLARAAPARRSTPSKNRRAVSASSRRERRVRVEHDRRSLRPSRSPTRCRRPTPCGRSRRCLSSPSSCAFSAYQRCGIAYRPCTASTSACTDSSLASLARLRLAIHES